MPNAAALHTERKARVKIAKTMLELHPLRLGAGVNFRHLKFGKPKMGNTCTNV